MSFCQRQIISPCKMNYLKFLKAYIQKRNKFKCWRVYALIKFALNFLNKFKFKIMNSITSVYTPIFNVNLQVQSPKRYVQFSHFLTVCSVWTSPCHWHSLLTEHITLISYTYISICSLSRSEMKLLLVSV